MLTGFLHELHVVSSRKELKPNRHSSSVRDSLLAEWPDMAWQSWTWVLSKGLDDGVYAITGMVIGRSWKLNVLGTNPMETVGHSF